MKKKYTFLIILLLSCLSIISCDEILDNYHDKKAQENYVSPYKGYYIGSFSGDQNGILELNVDKSGSTAVTRTITTSGYTETFYTHVNNNGSFSPTPSPNSGFILYGNLNTTNNNCSGTWKANELKGNWQLTKK